MESFDASKELGEQIGVMRHRLEALKVGHESWTKVKVPLLIRQLDAIRNSLESNESLSVKEIDIAIAKLNEIETTLQNLKKKKLQQQGNNHMLSLVGWHIFLSLGILFAISDFYVTLIW